MKVLLFVEIYLNIFHRDSNSVIFFFLFFTFFSFFFLSFYYLLDQKISVFMLVIFKNMCFTISEFVNLAMFLQILSNVWLFRIFNLEFRLRLDITMSEIFIKFYKLFWFKLNFPSFNLRNCSEKMKHMCIRIILFICWSHR